MKSLELTVLVTEGPQARAYLAAMRRRGIRPQRVLLLVQGRRRATGKRVTPWLPRGLRRGVAERLQEAAENFWPRQIRARHEALVDRIFDALEAEIEDPAGILAEIGGPFRYEEYADEVRRVLVEGWRDPTLIAALADVSPAAVLFTGGGIVPSEVLRLEGIRLLHVHPGTLPHVRGADGLLWSVLVRGRPGASCFYMAEGIDTGDVIAARDRPPIRIDLGGIDRPDDQTLYRALFSFIDPLLRAELLVSAVLERDEHPLRYPSTPQTLSEGLAYHFMHPDLRAVALRRVFVGA